MANINICIDDQLKRDSEMVFDQLGISLSAGITLYLKQVVRTNGIPFELKADPFYSYENQSRLMIAKERMEKTSGPIQELIEDVDD
ncbi:MAG: type II toxin-antitoxin system RelB/DinJ family antitoxin [Erysipelotrichaceae bacterium]|nr:type II toxin-antitoxin system RelB/DinJ family antitoxin [Erysipelotrichaceae bacterium]